MATTEITEEEIGELSEKLQEFAKGLSPRQQSLLGMILVRAVQGDGEDVEGQSFLMDPTGIWALHHATVVEWDFLQFHVQTILTHLASLHHAQPVPWSGALTE